MYEVWVAMAPLPANMKRYGVFVMEEDAFLFKEQIKYEPLVQSSKIKKIDRRV